MSKKKVESRNVRHVNLTPEAKAIRHERARRAASGGVISCTFADKVMYDTRKDAAWTCGQLAQLGYLFDFYNCRHPNASHYHLTTLGFSHRAHSRARERRQAINDQHPVGGTLYE